MREILHAELLISGLDTVLSGEGRWPAEVRGMMDLEYEVAQREHAPLCVFWIAIDDLERRAQDADIPSEVLVASVAGALRVLPREGDLLALKDGSAILVMLPRASAEAAEALAKRLVEAAKRLPVANVAEPLVASVSIGLATARYDAGYWLETLLAVARDGAEVAATGGGSRVVHTELYSFHQRRLERLNPTLPKPVAPPPPAQKPTPSPPRKPAGALPAIPSAIATAATTAGAATVKNGGTPSVKAPGGSATDERAATSPGAGGGDSRQNIQDLEEKVLWLAREWAQEGLAKALAEQKKEHSSQVDLLERRIKKLSLSLEEAHRDLERAQGGAATDPGVASAYRAVQGLHGGRDVAVKLELLSKLVEMNLTLRAQFSGKT